MHKSGINLSLSITSQMLLLLVPLEHVVIGTESDVSVTTNQFPCRGPRFIVLINSHIYSCESSEQVLKLYRGHQKLADILQDKGSASSAGGGASSSHGNKRGSSGAVCLRYNLSLQFVLRLLRAIFRCVDLQVYCCCYIVVLVIGFT